MTLQLNTRALLAATIAILCTSCAMKVRPGGGPPDTVPAKIVNTVPTSGTTNMKDDKVTILFDDYIDRSISSSITVQPRTRIAVSYAGDEITVSFTEPLAADVTYSITVGTDWRDLKGNKPQEAYTMIFSTGNAIDTGFVSGVVHGSSLSDVVILCYSNADTLSESFSAATTQAPYVVPIGSSGSFYVRGLPDGVYRVIAVKDENKNYLVDPQEYFGTSPTDVTVSNGISAPVNLLIGNPKDATPPQLVIARSVSSIRHYVSFSEPIKVLPEASVTLIDSIGNQVPAKKWWVQKQHPERLYFITPPATTVTDYKVSVSNSSVSDSVGNQSTQGIYSGSIRTSTVKDTVSFFLLKTSMQDSSKSIPTTSRLIFSFSDAVDTSLAVVTALLHSRNSTTPGVHRWLSLSELEVATPSPLSPSTWYEYAVTLSNLGSVSGAMIVDTTIRLSVLTADRVDSGSVAGRFIDSAGLGGPYILQFINKSGIVEHSMSVNNNESFVVRALLPGDYSVRVFQDQNNNQALDLGQISPYKSSEKWFQFPVNLQVRKRWTLEDVTLVIR
jgi:uncharacterized protein (DUF2141 family)